MSDEVTPFRIDIPEVDLRDLQVRLEHSRWPEDETVDDWSQGVPRSYLRDLCRHWADEYDWRATEARLNDLPQYRTEIGGLGVHFIHGRSPHPDALPLVMTHGWPGSVVEFLKVIGPLTDPTAYGGDAADAFHVVCPSLPGYGFSDKPARRGWNVERIADAWIRLMARLGYERYGAEGSDWGTSVSTSIAQQDPDHVGGIHVIPPLAAPDPATFDDLTDAERAALSDLKRAEEWESGYATQQSTRPQTLGYALLDSPVGLCAWIVEKFWSWTDNDGDLESVLTRDEVLDNVTLYWLTGTAASSARLYWESFRQVAARFSGTTALTATSDVSSSELLNAVTAPTGCSIFPKEIPRPSRRWAEKRFTDIRYWNELDKGGHFAALEQPNLFVNEVRSFFRLLR